MKNPISKFLLGCSLAFGALGASAQGLEQIIVEQYYEASAADVAASEAGSADATIDLATGSRTYRIYADLQAGFKLETVFGNANHPLDLSTTTFFYNQTDRGTVFGHTNATARLDESTCAIDSYLTFGMAGSTKRGVLKSADADATAVIFPNSEGSPVMENSTPWMGTALTSADGLATGTLLTCQTIGTASTTAFSNNSTNTYATNNGAWFVLGGAQGEDPNGTNRILIAQVTTNGTLSFHLSMRVSPQAGGSFTDYVWSNPTGNEVTIPSLTFPLGAPDCLGVPGGPALPGTACDDGLATTGNDVYDANCLCAGQLIDCLGVPGGTAVVGSTCDDGNANTGNDVYGANCVCAGQAIDCLGVPGGTAVIGSSCNDGNANTGNDVYGANCVCAGQAIDCLGVPGGAAVIGSACDDGNASTGNDVYGANCVCAGQAIDCLGVPGGTAVIGSPCNDGNANSTNDVYGANCVCAGTLANDCEGVPGGPAQPGTPCDDGNANTGNDVYGANCVCAGQVIDCLGVPGGTAVIGSACDDGNATTGNDVYGANCVCAGQAIDCLGVPGGTAVIGSPCDDGNANSTNDVYGANCVCAGMLANDCNGVPGGPAQPGTPCDDGQATTGNDMWNANCLCVGQLIDCLGVPGGTAVIGSACDDGDATTGNDVYGANCVCAGQPVDCLGVPGGTAVIGSACNDGNANTIGDVYNANCVCTGQLVDCLGVPGGSALPGTACDDGNANTIGDVYGANCTCAGVNPNCTEDLVLTINLDAFGSQTTWEVRDQNTNVIVANGGPYQDGVAGDVLENICVAAGCYQLSVFDALGDGISGGGYVLTDDLGRRIVDADGAFSSTSSISVPGEGDFCVPLGGTFVKPNWCDRTNLVPSSFIYCQGVAGATGYQFWFFDPHGSYGRRILKPATDCRLNFAQLPLPLNLPLNVRVRALVGGNYTAFGKACRLTVTGGSSLRDMSSFSTDEAHLSIFPNPNREEVLYVVIDGLNDEVLTANVEIFNAMGQRVSAEQVNVAEGTINHTMNLSAEMGAGMYIVQVTVDGKVFTERLMRQ